MTRTRIVLGLFAAAAVCGLAFLGISEATVVPMVARGAGPGGVQVTSGGWLSLLMSIMGTGGFTVAGIITMIAGRFGVHVPADASKVATDVVELTASFAALMANKSSRAAQRRFFFALVDSAELIEGVKASHEAGVVVIRYSGYADPTQVGSLAE